MEATQKKSFWMIILAVILIMIVVQIIWPAKKENSDANLIVISDTEQPIGTVAVSYARWDGSQVSEGGQNADNTLMTRGACLYFHDVRWPAVVTVYSDLRGQDELMHFVVEEEPEEGGIWQATIYDGEAGLTLSLESVPEESVE